MIKFIWIITPLGVRYMAAVINKAFTTVESLTQMSDFLFKGTE